MTTLVASSSRLNLIRQTQNASKKAFWRLLVIMFLFFLFVTLIVGRLATFALFGGAHAFDSVSNDYVPQRGDIVDRNGAPLARTIDAYAIWVNPDKIFGNKSELASKLSAIFPDTNKDKFYEKLMSDKSGYLRKRALPSQVKQVHALGEVAIEFPREAERLYPEHDLAAHILGFVNQNGKGILGIENILDKHLSDPETRGQPVLLSIDSRVQAALESELLRGIKSTGAKGGAGIVLDVNNGEIIAMSTLPSFNPNIPKFYNIPETYSLDADIKTPLSRQVNSVTNRVYELGSTFKPLTVAAALDAGTVRDLAIRYDATKPIRIDGHKISDTHASNRWLNVPEALVHSSNIVTARIADNLGKENMDVMLTNLGFNERPAIELGERAQPLWPKNWGRVTNMTVGYGHGISVTPLHLASAYAALVNGGIWRPSTLLKRKKGEKIEERRVFKAATSARMRQLLRMIVSDGTGKNADAPGYRVGGKTGSAEKPADGGYAKKLVVSTFAAAFPMDDPQYVIIAMVDEPSGTAASGFQRTAGWTAAPIVKKLVPRIGPMLNIIPDEHRDVDVSELLPLLWKAKG